MTNFQARLALFSGLFVPVLAGAIAGLLSVGGPAAIIVGVIGGLSLGTGISAAIYLWIGTKSIPFGQVIAGVGGETGVQPPIDWSLMGNGDYEIKAGNPRGAEGSGGLVLIILNGAPQAHVYGSDGSSVQFVVWGLINWQQTDAEELEESSSPEGTPFEEDETAQSLLILVAGANPWTHEDSTVMARHGVTFAVACDGHNSAMLGSMGETAPPVLRQRFNSILSCVTASKWFLESGLPLAVKRGTSGKRRLRPAWSRR